MFISIFFTTTSNLLNKDKGSFVVFCDVGQGDASYIHIEPNVDILIDAGKGSSVLNCLDKYMPPGDNIIEIAFLSHAQNDHYGGFLFIPNRFEIKHMYISTTIINSPQLSSLYKLLYKHSVKIEAIYAGDSLTVNNAGFQLIWPSKDFVEASTRKSDPNASSQVLVFSFDNYTILYTGDVSTKSLKTLMQQSIPKVDVLKIPHHGSKNGLIYELLVLADPMYAVISVGKKNAYGHPSPEIIKMLQDESVEILRTDQIGDVFFSLDQEESL